MTKREHRDTLAAARRVMESPNARTTQRQWAADVIAWLERGDEAARRRLGALA